MYIDELISNFFKLFYVVIYRIWSYHYTLNLLCQLEVLILSSLLVTILIKTLLNLLYQDSLVMVADFWGDGQFDWFYWGLFLLDWAYSWVSVWWRETMSHSRQCNERGWEGVCPWLWWCLEDWVKDLCAQNGQVD